MCSCNGCKGNPDMIERCLWRKKHETFLLKHACIEPEPTEMFEVLAEEKGLQAPRMAARTHSMLSILAKVHGHAFWSSGVYLDRSQSIDMARLRFDDCLPCLSTGSRLFSPSRCKDVSLAQLYYIMGFPLNHQTYFRAYTEIPVPAKRKLIGNTMNVAVVSYLTISAMIAADSPRLSQYAEHSACLLPRVLFALPSCGPHGPRLPSQSLAPSGPMAPRSPNMAPKGLNMAWIPRRDMVWILYGYTTQHHCMDMVHDTTTTPPQHQGMDMVHVAARHESTARASSLLSAQVHVTSPEPRRLWR